MIKFELFLCYLTITGVLAIVYDGCKAKDQDTACIAIKSGKLDHSCIATKECDLLIEANLYTGSNECISWKVFQMLNHGNNFTGHAANIYLANDTAQIDFDFFFQIWAVDGKMPSCQVRILTRGGPNLPSLKPPSMKVTEAGHTYAFCKFKSGLKYLATDFTGYLALKVETGLLEPEKEFVQEHMLDSNLLLFRRFNKLAQECGQPLTVCAGLTKTTWTNDTDDIKGCIYQFNCELVFLFRNGTTGTFIHFYLLTSRNDSQYNLTWSIAYLEQFGFHYHLFHLQKMCWALELFNGSTLTTHETLDTFIAASKNPDLTRKFSYGHKVTVDPAFGASDQVYIGCRMKFSLKEGQSRFALHMQLYPNLSSQPLFFIDRDTPVVPEVILHQLNDDPVGPEDDDHQEDVQEAPENTPKTNSSISTTLGNLCT